MGELEKKILHYVRDGKNRDASFAESKKSLKESYPVLDSEPTAQYICLLKYKISKLESSVDTLRSKLSDGAKQPLHENEEDQFVDVVNVIQDEELTENSEDVIDGIKIYPRVSDDDCC